MSTFHFFSKNETDLQISLNLSMTFNTSHVLNRNCLLESLGSQSKYLCGYSIYNSCMKMFCISYTKINWKKASKTSRFFLGASYPIVDVNHYHKHNSLVHVGLVQIPSRLGNLKADLTFYMYYRYIICCSESAGITENLCNCLCL